MFIPLLGVLPSKLDFMKLAWVVFANSVSKSCNRTTSFLLNNPSRIVQILAAEVHLMMISNKSWDKDLFRIDSDFCICNAPFIQCISIFQSTLRRIHISAANNFPQIFSYKMILYTWSLYFVVKLIEQLNPETVEASSRNY